MTDAMIVEAISSLRGSGIDPTLTAGAAMNVPDPDAVARFQAAMGTPAVEKTPEIPFADAAARSWQMAQDNHQGILHRIRALSALSSERALSQPELMELQYEVANLSFQQDVVTKVADKASTAIQTLIKNQ